MEYNFDPMTGERIVKPEDASNASENAAFTASDAAFSNGPANAAYAEVSPNPGKKVKGRKKPGLFRRFLAYICSMILFGIILCGLMVFMTQRIFRVETAKSVAHEVASISVKDFFGAEEETIKSFCEPLGLDETATVEEVAVAIYGKAFKVVGATEEELEKFMDSAKGQDFFEDTFGVCVDDILNGKEAGELAQSFIDYVDENREELEDELDITITDKELDEMKEVLDKDKISEAFKELTSDEVEVPTGIENDNDEASVTTETMTLSDIAERYHAALVLSWVGILISGAFFLLIMTLLLWDRAFFCRYLGVPMFYAGGIYALVMTVFRDASLEIIMDAIPERFETVADKVLSILFASTQVVSFTVCGIGLALFILGIISAVVMNRNARKEAELGAMV